MAQAFQPLLPALTGTMLFFLLLLIIWQAVWKGLGLWKSARNNQLAWFIAMLILNTAGILPIIYIALFQKKRASTSRKRKG
jgi:hypothetical protein